MRNVGVSRGVNGVNVQHKTASAPVNGAKKFLGVEVVRSSGFTWLFERAPTQVGTLSFLEKLVAQGSKGLRM